MLLVIDVGNTNIVFGIYNEDKLEAHWRMATDRQKSSDEMGIFIVNMLNYYKCDTDKVEGVIICSVVPPIMHSLINSIKKYIRKEPMVVGPGIKTGINIKYENPRDVGADRIVNAVAALEIYGGPLIIVDFGTATTFCAITKARDYLGGVICPGVKISAEALFQHAAKLPRIELQTPNSVIGRNTVTSMQSGLYFGYIGQVDYIVNRMKKEMNELDAMVIATGGLAKLIANESQTVNEINRLLTLEGLRIIYNINK